MKLHLASLPCIRMRLFSSYSDLFQVLQSDEAGGSGGMGKAGSGAATSRDGRYLIGVRCVSGLISVTARGLEAVGTRRGKVGKHQAWLRLRKSSTPSLSNRGRASVTHF